jgi:hypothetical protein
MTPRFYIKNWIIGTNDLKSPASRETGPKKINRPRVQNQWQINSFKTPR